MDFDRYQYEASFTMLPSAANYQYLITGLAAEAGEVAGVYAKHVRDETKVNDMRDKLTKELGDVLWFVAMLAELSDVDLAAIAEQNIEKLKSRQARGKLKGSGDER